MTEPLLLRRWGFALRYARISVDAPELIKRAQILAEDSKRPVALLLTKEVFGRRAVLKSR